MVLFTLVLGIRYFGSIISLLPDDFETIPVEFLPFCPNFSM